MKFSRQEFIQPYHHEIRGLNQNCTNFLYFQVSKTHSHAPSDEKSSASQISANPSTFTPFKHIETRILSYSTLEKLVRSIRMDE